MERVALLLLVSVFFVLLPRVEAKNSGIVVESTPERVYQECDKAYRACRGELCGIDRDYCVTWGRP